MKKKIGHKDEFGELSLDDLKEYFHDDEKLALSYLTEKFGYEITEEIKVRVSKLIQNVNT